MSKSNPELKSEYNSIARLRERVRLGLPQHTGSQFIVEELVDGVLNVRLSNATYVWCVVGDNPRGMTEAALLLHHAPTAQDAARTAVRWGLREGGKDGLPIHHRVIELLQKENEGSLLPVLQSIQLSRAYDSVLKVTWQARDGAEIVRWFDARELTKLSDDALVDVFGTGNLAEGERLPDDPEYSRWQYLKAFFTGSLK